jgi:hypothetical protein
MLTEAIKKHLPLMIAKRGMNVAQCPANSFALAMRQAWITAPKAGP